MKRIRKSIFIIQIVAVIVACGVASPISTDTTTTTPNIQPSIKETQVTTLPTLLMTVIPSATATVEPDFPEGCINLALTTVNPAVLNGLLVVEDNDINNYFVDPKTSQVLGIGDEVQPPSFLTFPNIISPNKKFMQAGDLEKGYDIIRTVDKIITTYVPEDDWNRGRWLDNEHIFYQNWLVPDGNNGNNIVIYNPFTGEQKNMQLNLPDPYIVIDGGGTAAWVKADIDPSLKRVLYNDKNRRLVLWNLDTQQEMTFLSPPTDLLDGTWSPDGKEFATPSPSQTSDIPVASELFTIDMDGVVRKLTDFNQKYPFASVDTRVSWSPDGRYIAFWLKISNVANANSKDLRQWLAITDITTLDTQIYCLSPNKPPTYGGDIVWSPDSQQLIVNTEVLIEELKPVLVDLTYQTQATLDTHGLWVEDWMVP